jgi:deoxyribonuclease-1
LIARRTSLAFLVVALLLAAPSFSAAPPGNTTNPSFSKAKKALLHNVYADHLLTFYCGSSFDGKGMLTHDGGYRPKKVGKRSQRLEWEHIVPAQAFGQSFSEWRQGDPACVDRRGKPFKGRNCAEKVNLAYRYMQADMHNLVPAIGEVNGLRSNYSFAMIPGEKRRFGSCDMEIESKKAEPPPEVRGDIARTYFYMEAAYPGRGIIGNKSRKMFEAWDKGDPVDAWECERTGKVAALQGNGNPFVGGACQEAGL